MANSKSKEIYSNAPDEALLVLDKMISPNEPDNEKIINFLKTVKHDGIEFDEYELKAIKTSLEIWDSISFKCTKAVFLKILINVNFRYDLALETMALMLTRGCAKTHNSENGEECSSLIATGKCEKTMPNLST